MQECLTHYPDRHKADYVINRLENGFDIGYSNATPHNHRNLLSATEHQHAVAAASNKDVTRGHLSGPFSTLPIPQLHCSPLGSREKKDGSRRLILDLSQPRGNSINNGINKEEFSVQYSHFDDATNMVHAMGKGCLMAIIDIQHAFRLLPVKQSQWRLLRIHPIIIWATVSTSNI